MCFRSDFEMQLVFLLLCVAAMVSARQIHRMELDCGRIPEGGTGLPWHVTINRKEQDDTDFKALCGGSIISNTLIVTAAHCFKPTSSSKVKVAQYKVVVAGGTQSLDVSDIKIPVSYLGHVTNYQSDIALVMLKTPLEFSTQVQPVCVDFDINFESRQLQQGSIGKALLKAGYEIDYVWVRYSKLDRGDEWSFCMYRSPTLPTITTHYNASSRSTVTVSTESEENRSSFKVLEIPYIPIVQCITKVPPNFREFITSDKFCAGQSNGTVIPRGNSGSGISFSDEDRGVVRHYLRGVVSTSPYREEIGAASYIVAFTQINKHEYFIKETFV